MIGKTLGNYKIKEEIGRGGMGVVYLGKHPVIGTEVVVKILPRGCTNFPKLKKKFSLEAKLMASLEHPNIVKVRNFSQIEDTYFFIMDYIKGKDLSQLIEEEKRGFPLNKAIEILLSVCSALSYAHAQKEPIIHRDIKPSNILILDEGRVYVSDFGIAKIMGDAAVALVRG
jgi:serine/threonine-protein kinase